MKTFFTADQHWHHGPPYTRHSIIYFCKRPYANIAEMDEDMIVRWNSVVGDDDVIYHLGDFGLAPVDNLQGIFKRLRGKKIAVLGNHDGSRTRLLRVGFQAVAARTIELEDGTILVHDPYSDSNLGNAKKRVLCGHIHNLWRDDGTWHNVGVDVRDFTPVTMDQIMGAV
jgi:calcineurin-like phosphoesterase family protein